MTTVLLVIQIIIVVSMIGIILMQRSSQDGFTGGGGTGMDSFMSSRASANFLTRTTSILATAFIVNSLILAYLASHSERQQSLIDEVDGQPIVPIEQGIDPLAPSKAPIAPLDE